MITHKGPLTTEEFMAWLKDGKDMLAVERTKVWACFIKIPQRDGIDLIFHQDGYTGLRELPCINSSFRFTGLYKQDEQKLYCPNVPACAVSDWKEDPAVTERSLTEEFCKGVMERIEDRVNNGRKGLPKELSDEKLIEAVASYRELYADEAAARLLVESSPDKCLQFRSKYTTADMDDGLLDFLQDRKGFVDRTAMVYISLHKEEILAELMKIDILREKYEAILADPDNPLHRMRQISDAVRSSGATTVRVTIEKDGAQATIRTSAKSLSGYHPTYNDFDAPAADSKVFREAFGSWANYTAADVRAITYGRKTIYEAPAPEVKQAEMPDKGFTMTMGGM